MLSDLKVIDFTTLLPGPFATMLLADFGAHILHVTKPNEEDPIRDSLSRSKKVIALNLKSEQNVKQLKEVIKEADVLIEQFRPGVMERFGLSYDDVKKINERIIYCSITGYGQTGPYALRAGHDINYISIAGLSSYSGTKNEGPANNSVQLADIGGGSMYAVTSILAAYIHRQKTGKGQHIDVSMTDASLTYNAVSLPAFFEKDKTPKPQSELLNGGTFYGFYETKDNRFFSVGSLEKTFRKKLCETVGIDYIEEDMHLLKEQLQHAFKNRTFEQLNTLFKEVDACVEPVLTLEETFNHPQMKARNVLIELRKNDGTIQKQLRNPVLFSNYTINYTEAKKLHSLDEL